jgi:hypothetical protein
MGTGKEREPEIIEKKNYTAIENGHECLWTSWSPDFAWT